MYKYFPVKFTYHHFTSDSNTDNKDWAGYGAMVMTVANRYEMFTWVIFSCYINGGATVE